MQPSPDETPQDDDSAEPAAQPRARLTGGWPRRKAIAWSLAAHAVLLGLLFVIVRSPPPLPQLADKAVIVDLVALANSATPTAPADMAAPPAPGPARVPPPTAPQPASAQPVSPQEPTQEPLPARVQPETPRLPQAVEPDVPTSRQTLEQGGGSAENNSVARPATSPAASAAASAAKANYARVILSRLQRAIRYPRAAQRRGVEGVVRVQVELAATGALRNVSLAQTSGSTVLDEAAMALVRRVAPFPPVPAGLLGSQGGFAFVAPIQYQLD